MPLLAFVVAFLGLLVLLAFLFSLYLLDNKHEWGKTLLQHLHRLLYRHCLKHCASSDYFPEKAPHFCESYDNRFTDALDSSLHLDLCHAKTSMAVRKRKEIFTFEGNLRERGSREAGGIKVNGRNLKVADKLVPASSLGSPSDKRNEISTAEVFGHLLCNLGPKTTNLGSMESGSCQSKGPDFSGFLPFSTSTKDALSLLPLNRLVLEILVSPTSKEEDDGSLWSVSAVRLKLATDSNLEHLEKSAHVSELADEVKDFQQPGKKSVGRDDVKRLYVPVDLIPMTQDVISKLELQSPSCNMKSEACICRYSNLSVANSLLKYGISVVKLLSTEASSGGGQSLLDDVGNIRCFLLKVRTPSTNVFEKEGLAILEDANSAGLQFLVDANEVDDDFVDFKLVKSSCNCSCAESLSGLQLGEMDKERHPDYFENCYNLVPLTTLDALGSFGLTFVKGYTEGQLSNDTVKEVSAQASSTLASLNISSVCKRQVEIDANFALSVHRDELNNCHDAEMTHHGFIPYHSHNSIAQLERQEYEHGMHLKDGHVVSHASRNEGLEDAEVDQMKKEKKRKKNRGRRQKGKGLVSAMEVKEQHELGKIALEASKNVTASSRTDFGCLCGMNKGEFHNSNCPYPFTSSGSMLQRKMKEQYDELVRSNAAKTLTLAQVGRFTTCLVESKAALQQKSEMIQRRFTIAKSLLTRADKSSFDRICGQIYGLEIEQKKLEEDTMVYNRLQEQLKLSPAYQKMLEYGRAHFELQPRTGQIIEKFDSEDIDISFEELLAQEKKDAFWKKHSLPRSSAQLLR